MDTKESASKHGSPSFPRLRRYLSIHAVLVGAALLESGWLTGCDLPEEADTAETAGGGACVRRLAPLVVANASGKEISDLQILPLRSLAEGAGRWGVRAVRSRSAPSQVTDPNATVANR